MAIISTSSLGDGDVSYGYIDVYQTLVKGTACFDCACGYSINVQFRKEFKKSSKYQFTITHRNREKRVSTYEPLETTIFDKMLQVSTYAACRFPKNDRGRRRVGARVY